MIKGIIFDLDQTVVDTSIAEQQRKSRNWQVVYMLIPSFKLYSGFNDVFSFIKSKGLRCCIVTTSQGVYAKKVVDHFKIPCEFIIDYYSTTQKKPHPAPMMKALDKFSLANNEVISFGDRAIDIQSSNSANIKSIACTWGTNEMHALIASNPFSIINYPNEIITTLNNL